MEYRRLGASGLQVSVICLGTMMFGEHTSRAVAARIIASARAAGVNFIDTADSYGARPGDCERIVGQLIARERDRWVLATKFASRVIPEDPNSGGHSRKWMLRAAEASLRRLGTDYIDVYYFHRDDPQTPLEESLRAMEDLVRGGKVRYFGLSNFPGWRTAALVSECRRIGVPQPIVLQPCYNALHRVAEVEMLPACRDFGLGVVPYSVLARGVLTGKYRPGAPPPRGSRGARREPRFLETEMHTASLRIAQRIRAYCERRGVAPAHFAFSWVLNNALVTSALAGPRTFAQWRHYLAALDYRLSAEDEAFVESLVPAGHPATPGYTDPKYPVTGRVPRSG